MSNVKSVRLEFTIDFDFGGCMAVIGAMKSDRAELLRPIEQLQNTLFVMTGMPGVGLSLGWAPAPSRDNEETGGVCSRFRGVITGSEAFSWGSFDNLRFELEAIPHTTIDVWKIEDVYG